MGASATAFLLFDADATSDHLKAVELKTDSNVSPAVEYYAEVGASNNGLTQASGTITVAQFSNQIDGASTAFTTDFASGDLVKLDNGTAAQATYGRVQSIESNTLMFIDKVSQRAYSGDDIFKQSFKPDILKDSIIAKITTSSGTVYSLNVIYGITAGVTGADGANGPKTLTHFVYHQASSSSQPSTPSATSYTFSTNSFNGLTSGWATTPPTFAAGNTNKYWYSYFTAEENTAGGDTASGSNLTFQASVQGIGFSGLVTFTGDNISDGSSTYNPATVINSNTTTINGGKISTGTIALNRLDFNPVTSVAGVTGTTISAAQLSSAGLTLTSSLADGATTSVADIRAGTSKSDVGLSQVDNNSTATIRAGTTSSDVGLGSVANKNERDQLKGAFTNSLTFISSGNIFLGISGASATNYIELSAANANIIIADNT